MKSSLITQSKFDHHYVTMAFGSRLQRAGQLSHVQHPVPSSIVAPKGLGETLGDFWGFGEPSGENIWKLQKLRSGENIKRLGKTLENSGGIIGADWETLGKKCWNSLEHVR